MITPDKVLSGVLERAKPVLDRFGVLGSPVRDLYSARRAITIERQRGDVERFLLGSEAAAAMFGPGAETLPDRGDGADAAWRIPDRGRAEAHLRTGPSGATEVVLQVTLDSVRGSATAPLSRPRYADNAGVVASRAVRRAKSLIETGEVPTLAANPAGRAVPDPYGE